MTNFGLTEDTLAYLMPMHILINETGHISQAGPTIAKMFEGQALLGKRFLELFELRRPSAIHSIRDLRDLSGSKIQIRTRCKRRAGLKGAIASWGDGKSVLLNLSFGIGVLDAVTEYNLSNADFAPTDLTVEMLYLVEAKAAVMYELKKLNSKLQGDKCAAEETANTDTLTGLSNRRALDRVLARYTAQNESFGLMHLDLDYFKSVNDNLGHAAGDFVLQSVASILRKETRSSDTVVRSGGDEFIIVFLGLTDVDILNNIALRIIAKLEAPMLFEGQTCRISASVGTTTSDFYSVIDIEKMQADADKALYASKHKGRACATVYSQDLQMRAN
ncbi:diguanylate cyclase domain-containing protein [Cochlodiniinecator piscidefendens]|uniref:diguanylate cyclase domain-containing protein n=1 Tax=Cochlodiniinecator piscidefendens TaxID=2715756 RepID=UPI00140AAA3F|nr:GGDEF domain-containing protein [Cochlodiniinecator piscidefendens]